MTPRTRQLRNETFDKAARHRLPRLPGLNSRDMVGWANLNLIDFLNRAEGASVRRVLEIIELIQEAHSIAEESSFYFWLDQPAGAAANEQYFSCKNRVGSILSKLNALLSRYNCKAEIRFYGASLHRDYLFSGKRGEKPEIVAVAFLIESLPVVHRVRRCSECRRWFFGITEHQKYCGDNCRKRHAAQGAEFLEQRRVYMRDYRRKQKMAEANSMKHARRG